MYVNFNGNDFRTKTDAYAAAVTQMVLLELLAFYD